MRYPYSRPHLSDLDTQAVLDVLQGQYLTQGPVVEQLESALENLFSVKHAVICNSGTAALHMAYHGLGLGPEAGLITSPITFLATATAARMCNAPVGFADVDPATGHVTLETIKAAVASAAFPVRAIAVVHLGGRACSDTAEISAYAESIGASLVEDACHAPMAGYFDATGHFFQVGSCAHSQAASLSFHAIKHITTGEGGVLLTNDEGLAARARLFRSHGIIRDPAQMTNSCDAGAPWYYEMHELGYNYRLSEINCALALNQIGKLEENIQRRRQIAELYHRHLSDLNYITLPTIPDPDSGTHAWHLFAPAFDFDAIGKSRREVMNELASQGIGSQVHYIPLYHQPYYYSCKTTGAFEGSEAYYKHTLSLPMYYGLSDDDIGVISGRICSVINP